MKTITRPILTNPTRPHVFSSPITVDHLVKAASVSSIRVGMTQTSIKTYFLKGKAHESGNCREDQIEKNATAAKQIEQENASEAKQPRMEGDAHKNLNETSEMSSKQANIHGENASSH